MRRIALLGTAIFGLAGGVVACGQNPVQPSGTASARTVAASDARKGTSPLACESSVYPVSLCLPANRPALCAALRGPDSVTFDVLVNARLATATVNRTTAPAAAGSVEVVTIPRPYGLPPVVLTFNITDDQIAKICPTV